MKKSIGFALAAVSCVAGSSAALAAAIVTVTENGVVIASWEQSLTPTPLASGALYTDVSVFNATGLGSSTDVLWYPASNGGGLSSYAGDMNIAGIPAEFTGSTSAPVFAYGTFYGIDTGATGEKNNVAATITISVPEPATWAMMLVGLGMVGLATRRRQKVTVTYA